MLLETGLPSGDRRWGLSGTALKMIAMITMLLDHIHYMFEFTGKVPLWFSQLARISAPLFLFCVAEGFAHTRNRRRYFLRIYLIAALMGAVRYLMLMRAIPARGDGFVPENAILTTYALLLIIWQGFDELRARRFVRGALLVAVPLAWRQASLALIAAVPALRIPVGFLCYTLLPAWGTSADVGLPVLALGMVLYALREHRAWQMIGFAAVALASDFALVWRLVSAWPGFEPMHMVTRYYQWMEVFAIPLMLCYNGRRGRGYQRLFYAFYPGHVYALYALSCVVISATLK